MDYIEQIKSGIEGLYRNNPNIHISVSKTHPKIIVDASPAKIVGVYKNIFQVEECEGGKMPTRHTFQYGDVLIGQVMIEELNFVRPVSVLNKK
ncbi:MAG: hypothetical protein IJD50_00025 [Clostridia bacterium]|nr:hypothetical protein [Clostridia bacterium]